MGSVIVIEFVTLDGVAADPDGSQRSAYGGWAFRHGPQTVAGDKFDLGPVLDTGVLLLGRKTWQLFAGLWPTRTDGFSAKMNSIPKLVVSRSLSDVQSWNNSSILAGDLADAVNARRAERDVVVAGSLSVVHALTEQGLVDEYRLLVYPTVLGVGERLFAPGSPPRDLTLMEVRQTGAAALLRYVAA